MSRATRSSDTTTSLLGVAWPYVGSIGECRQQEFGVIGKPIIISATVDAVFATAGIDILEVIPLEARETAVDDYAVASMVAALTVAKVRLRRVGERKRMVVIPLVMDGLSDGHFFRCHRCRARWHDVVRILKMKLSPLNCYADIVDRSHPCFCLMNTTIG